MNCETAGAAEVEGVLAIRAGVVETWGHKAEESSQATVDPFGGIKVPGCFLTCELAFKGKGQRLNIFLLG